MSTKIYLWDSGGAARAARLARANRAGLAFANFGVNFLLLTGVELFVGLDSLLDLGEVGGLVSQGGHRRGALCTNRRRLPMLLVLRQHLPHLLHRILHHRLRLHAFNSASFTSHELNCGPCIYRYSDFHSKKFHSKTETKRRTSIIFIFRFELMFHVTNNNHRDLSFRRRF